MSSEPTATTRDGLTIHTTYGQIGSHSHLQVVLSNSQADPVDAWSLDLAMPTTVAGVYGALLNVVSPAICRLTGDAFTRTVPAQGSVTCGILFDAA